ncbi:hypothetical protein Ancab_036573 [Ancistrocladus abbreviatus]
MAKVSKTRRLKSGSPFCKSNPYQKPSCSLKVLKHVNKKKHHSLEKNDWEDATCSVCLEFPHNAVLLLCSSYDKGCRPYMCATSCRFSNCLDQYKKAYTRIGSVQSIHPLGDSEDALGLSLGSHDEKLEVSELLCPLCRGQVKGWTVVKPARKFLNKKKRSCMQENCSFVGNYKQLRKHVRVEHPLARPREVDPILEEEWKRLEQERERSDVISTVTSSAPGSFVVGDYLIEGNFSPFFRDYNVDDLFHDTFFQFETFGRRNGGLRFTRGTGVGYRLHEDDDMGVHRRTALAGEVRDIPAGRLLFRQAVRRRRRREAERL